MITVLVTGGAGFIGSHLIPKLLATGINVRVLDVLTPQVHGQLPQNLDWLNDSRLEFIRGDVCDRLVWEQVLEGVDAVVHLAAETGTGQSMYEVARYSEVNTQATALMFDVLGKQKNRSVKRVLLSSSRSVYGEGAYLCNVCSDRVYPSSRSQLDLENNQWEPVCPSCSGPLDVAATLETDQVLPASIYAATKLAQEDLVRIGCEALGLEHITYRLQNVYGEGQSLNNPYTGILSIFSTKIRLGKELPLFEDGKESRDFIHVDDVTDALLEGLLVKKAPNAIINVGSGVATTVIEVARLLSLAFAKSPNLVVTGEYRLGDIRHNYADINRLDKHLNVRPKVDLETGLNRFTKWVEEQDLPEDKLDAANQELIDKGLMGSSGS